MPARKPANQAFILRLWQEDNENDSRIWRGWIQHVGSGEKVFVQNLTDLLDFIEQHFGALADANRLEDKENATSCFDLDGKERG